jgi:PAS domain S-box-containing protein
MEQSVIKQPIPWPVSLLFLVFSLFVITGGFLYYKTQKKRIVTENQNEIAAIASLKVQEITAWRNERFGDAEVLHNNSLFINEASGFLNNKHHELGKNLIDWMKSLTTNYDYQSVLIIDNEKKIRLSYPSSDTTIGEIPEIFLAEVIRKHKVVMTDLHKSANVLNAHLDLLVPLFTEGPKDSVLVGIVILRIDAEKSLFPIIESWPTPSKSSETLLVHLKGDSIEYLNDLRHKKNSSLILKLASNQINLPAAKAASGYEGLYEGIDYRNEPVISYLVGVPGSPWFMVAKTDKKEIYSPLNEHVTTIFIIVALLILTASALLGFFWRNQLVGHYRKQLELENESRLAEKALRETELMYRSLFENMLNGFAYCKMIFDENGEPCDFTYQSVNVAFETLTGLKNVTGKNVSDVIPGFRSTDQKLLDIYGRVARSGNPENFEMFVESLKMWFLVSVYCPGHGYFVSVFDVITERKNMVESLRQSEEKFRNLFEQSPVGNSMTQIDGRIFVNRVFCDMLGYSEDELREKNWREITHSGDIKMTEKIIQSQLNRETEISRLEKRYIHKNGSIVYAEVTTFLHRDKEGNPKFFITSLNDITERKLKDQIISESERKYRYLFESNPQVMWIYDLETLAFLEVNDAAVAKYGYSRKEFLSFTLKDIRPVEDVPFLLKDVEQTRNKLNNAGVWRHRKKSGEIIFVEITSHLTEFSNRVARLVIANDVTESKLAAEQIQRLNEELEQRVQRRTIQLEAVNKELEAFSYSVSHDLRAPLRAIHSFTRILREDYDKVLDDEGKRICKTIELSAVQLGQLIDDLLAFSRVGRTELQYSKIDMTSLARSVYTDLVNQDEAGRIDFKVNKLHAAHGDIITIRLVMINLLSNALKYTSRSEKAEISVGSDQNDGEVVYYVKDNGVGFDMQYYDKLFGVFQRLHSSKEFEGNGVGLAIIKRIVQRHKGKVWAEGAVGKGATFYFTLPVKEKKQVRA